MATCHLMYGFWLDAEGDAPAGVDPRIWENQSPKRALEIGIAAARIAGTFKIVEAWDTYKLGRVYVGWDLAAYEGQTYLGGNGPVPVAFHAGLRELFGRFSGREYGWHMFSTDEEA